MGQLVIGYSKYLLPYSVHICTYIHTYIQSTVFCRYTYTECVQGKGRDAGLPTEYIHYIYILYPTVIAINQVTYACMYSTQALRQGTPHTVRWLCTEHTVCAVVTTQYPPVPRQLAYNYSAGYILWVLLYILDENHYDRYQLYKVFTISIMTYVCTYGVMQP